MMISTKTCSSSYNSYYNYVGKPAEASHVVTNLNNEIDGGKINFFNRNGKCQVVIGSHVSSEMYSIFYSCKLLSTDFTNWDISIWLQNSCREIIFRENVSGRKISRVDGSGCELHTVKKNWHNHIRVPYSISYTRISRGSMAMANGNIPIVDGKVSYLKLYHGQIEKVQGGVDHLKIANDGKIDVIIGDVGNLKISQSRIGNITGNIENLVMYDSMIETITGNVANSKMLDRRL